ncbi:hypothetical protein [Actinoplanes friuliensis]|uniref:hypothetical protein n=1 Tax=Actinoplanes friuliensis TaxID=196914 RepID=UPI0011DD5EBD|nr:hypothetical protein [Actinoplanes friuliensis]
MNRRGFLTIAAGVPLAAAGLPAAPALADDVPMRGRVTGLLARDVTLVRPAGWDRLRGFVQPLTWAEAQPEPSGDVSEAALQKLRDAAGVARARGYTRLKLRLLAGYQSPAWALALGGGPMVGWEDPDPVTPLLYDVPVWWADDFLAAYTAFLPKLAAALEPEPLWGEVTVSGTCTVFAEPCIKQLGVAANRAKAIGREYTDTADRAALETVIAAHQDAFTPRGITSSVAYNPWQYIDPGTGRLKTDPDITIELMEFQKRTMGSFGVWENNSLIARRVDGRLEQTRADYQSMYDHMTAAGAAGHPIQFQTATLAKIEAEEDATVETTASWVAENHGISVELPRGWEQEATIDTGRATALNNRMVANAATT